MDCVFCQIVRGERPAKIVFKDEDVTAFRDIHPQAPIHILVIPNRHLTTLNDLTDADQVLAGKMILTLKRVAEQEGVAERGYRVVTNVNRGGGQYVWHLHWHLLAGRPMRWPPG